LFAVFISLEIPEELPILDVLERKIFSNPCLRQSFHIIFKAETYFCNILYSFLLGGANCDGIEKESRVADSEYSRFSILTQLIAGFAMYKKKKEIILKCLHISLTKIIMMVH